MNDWPKVAIIVLNWNGWRDTIECLELLQRITYPNYQIIVVDNGSTDDSVEKIKAWARGEIPVESQFVDYESATKPVKWVEYDREIAKAGGILEEAGLARLPSNRKMVLIQTEENLGFAGGNNLGIRFALENGADYVWLLNNDTVVDPNALTSLVKAAERIANCGIAGSKILYYEAPTIIDHAGVVVRPWQGRFLHIGSDKPDAAHFNVLTRIEYVDGCSMLVKKQLVEEIGLLDESYFLYHEDADWCIRARRHGWKIIYVPSSKVYHKKSRSTHNIRPLKTYYCARNSLRFMFHYYPWSLLPAPMWWSRFYLLNHIFKRRWSHLRASLLALRDFLLGRSGPAPACLYKKTYYRQVSWTSQVSNGSGRRKK